MSRKKNSRQWARLRILCQAGLDLMTIAQDAFTLVRELIPSSGAELAPVSSRTRPCCWPPSTARSCT